MYIPTNNNAIHVSIHTENDPKQDYRMTVHYVTIFCQTL